MQPALGVQPAASTVPAPPPAQESAFGVGRVIARTFSVWRRHVVVFSLMSLASSLPLLVMAFGSGMPVPGITAPNANPLGAGATPTGMPPGFWQAYLVTMLLYVVEAGAMTHGVIHHLAGKRVSLGAMVAAGLRRFVPLLLVGALCYLMLAVGLVLLVVPGVYLACALAVAVPAVVVERPGILGAVKRSFALTKGKRFAILAVFLVMFVVVFLVSAFAGFVLPALTSPFAPAAGALLGFGVNVVFGTLLWVAPGVVYHDLRVAKEGVATAQLAAIFE